MVHMAGVVLIVIRAGAITLVLTLGLRLPRDQLRSIHVLLLLLLFLFLSYVSTRLSKSAKKKKKKKKTKKSWLSFGLPGFTFQNTCVEDCQLRTQPHITTTHNHTKDRNPLQGNPFTVTFPQDY
ncbi:hypothetical protein ACN38_g9616 [Penicillium nordicum]|uniref:Uncharacterized protein n=1 Tax=Penicillium nordicum TaxID=229535 RepID=A0A0M8P2W2_9EURO|nr:hypothetical protein ACN38_g9616 [Penicillium nordicum]